MWERMQQSEGGSGIDFLSTHPANERRIKAIRKWLPEVRACTLSTAAATRADGRFPRQANHLREDNCGPTAESSGQFGQFMRMR